MHKGDKPTHKVHPKSLLLRILELHKGRTAPWPKGLPAEQLKHFVVAQCCCPMPNEPHGPMAADLTASINDLPSPNESLKQHPGSSARCKPANVFGCLYLGIPYQLDLKKSTMSGNSISGCISGSTRTSHLFASLTRLGTR